MPTPELKLVTATWSTPRSEEFWEKLGSVKSSASQDRDLLTLGPTLPDSEESRIAAVVVRRHPDGQLHWGLTVRPPPTTEPPEVVKEYDRNLGGRRGLVSLLTDVSASSSLVGSFRIRLFFAEAQFSCRVIPITIEKGVGHDAALLLGHRPRLEQVGYRFEGGGAGGIEEVVLIYDHNEKRYQATVYAAGPLKLGSVRWLPFVDDIGELVQAAFFAPKEGQS